MGQIVSQTEKIKGVHALLKRYQRQISESLPRHMTAERMLRVAMTAIRRTPALLECDPMTLIGAIVEASQLGLEIGVLGQAYLVPFKNKNTGKKEVQLIPGYRGLINLARRSGEITSLDAHVVYEHDKFEFSYGTDGRLHHEPNLDSERGKVRCAYAYARLQDGGYAYDVLTLSDLEKVKASSKSASGPWQSWEEEMQRKTAVKRLCKYLPCSIELAQAISHDNAADSGEHQVFDIEAVALPSEEPKSKIEALTERLNGEEDEKADPGAEPVEKEQPKESPVVRCKKHTDVDASDGCWKCTAEREEQESAKEEQPKNTKPKQTKLNVE